MSNWKHLIFRAEGVGDVFLLGLLLGAGIGFVIGLYA